jgi:hypothetical protein
MRRLLMVAISVSCALVVGSAREATLPGAPGAQGQPVAGIGEWNSNSLDGMWNTSAECAGTSWTERRVSLTPVPGQPGRVRGEWAKSHSRIWMKHDATRCRWPGQSSQDTFAPMQFAVSGFELTGESTSPGTFSIHGRYVNCSGNGCAALYPKGREDDFDTELRLSGDILIDTNRTATTDDDLAFAARAAHTRAEGEISAAVRPLLQMLDKRDVDSFYTTATTDIFRNTTSRDQLAEGLKVMQSRATIVSRDVFRCIVASRAEQFSKAPGQFALLVNNAYLSGNRNTLEFVFLTRVDGQWRINSLFWS